MKRWKVFVSVLCFAGSSCLFAATNSWKAGTGDWDTPNNWSLNERPASDQDIIITNTGTFSVTVDDGTQASAMNVLSLTLSNVSGASMLLITNRPSSTGSLTLTVLLDARFATGSVLQLVDASALGSGVRLFTSNFFNNSTISIATNAILAVTNCLSVGTSSNQVGTLTTAGGVVNARTVSLGEAPGSLGTWTILDGTNLVGETLQIGSDTGTGVVNQVGGKLIVGGNASDYGFGIAGSDNSTGAVILVNGSILASSIAIGERGSGSLTMSNGLFQVPGIDIGVRAGAVGRLNIAGGSISLGNYNMRVGMGPGASGEFWMTGGFLETTHDLLLGNDFFNGTSGIGKLVISNGVLHTQGLGIAELSGSVGTVTIAGGSVVADEITLSTRGQGFLWQTGGELVVTGETFFGTVRILGGGNLICSGGVVRVSEVTVGTPSGYPNGDTFWYLAGGTSTVDRTVALFGDANHVSLLTVSGGRLQTPILNLGTLAGGGAVTISGGELQVTERLDVGATAGAPSLVSINGGSLKIASIGSPMEFPAFIGADGQGEMLISSGSFTANEIWVGGPPSSVGTLTVSGGLVDAATSTFGTTLLVGEYAGSTGLVLYTGGNLHTRTITLGDGGFGSMFVSSNADFQPLGIIVGNQSGAAGELNLRGGMLFSSPLRRVGSLQVGVAAESTGAVWVTDGALLAGGNTFGCFQDNSVLIGMQGSGRLSATNSTLGLYNLTVGANGTLECVNSEFYALDGGCPTINSNVMLFINSTGSFEAALQNSATIMASGSTLTFLQSVNNSGTIIATNGTMQFLGGINNSGNVVFGPDQFLITSVVRSNSNVVISWRAFGGNHYLVQATTNFPASYSDIDPEIVAAGSDFSVTNYIDVGAVTNFPSRIYRVRQEF